MRASHADQESDSGRSPLREPQRDEARQRCSGHDGGEEPEGVAAREHVSGEDHDYPQNGAGRTEHPRSAARRHLGDVGHVRKFSTSGTNSSPNSSEMVVAARRDLGPMHVGALRDGDDYIDRASVDPLDV